MKPTIHPDYRQVVFRDATTGHQFRTGSTVATDATVELDGVEYPLVVVDVTSDSHPFWTGSRRVVDTEGRVERFRRRYAGRGPLPGTRT